MSLDPRYVTTPALEQFYIDKSTGFPLANGKITFYKDNERSLLKSIYTLSGAPPNYSYVALPNPLTLSSVGTIQDNNGNNVLPFYFPYDEQGNLELYYVTVYSCNGILQFTREGWPNLALENNQDKDNSFNLIPNGQFLIHNNIPPQENKVAGEITQAVTTLAPGAWTFNRPDQSTAKDLVFFERFGSSVSNPTGYPRYAIRIENQLPSPGDLVKDLRISFRNVNRFASKDQYYTFAFAAQTNTGNALNVTALVIKNFGQGGTPVEEKIINTITLTSTYTLSNIPFIFGENANKTLGLNDDDTVAIALRFPTNSVFDVSLTDFILKEGNTQIETYPQITDSKVISQSLAGSLPVPNPDGSDIYLPIIASKTGLMFYDGDIGKIFSTLYSKPRLGELLCDGSRYPRSGFSPDSIPYARIAKVLWDEDLGYYCSGNGTTFVTANLDAKNRIILTTNQPNSANEASKGTSGFSIDNVFLGNNHGLTAFLDENELGQPIRVTCQSMSIGSDTPPKAETSGFTITDLRNADATKQVFQIDCIEAKDLAGKYFSYSKTSDYYVWFTVDGKGDDPKPKKKSMGFKLPLIGTQTAEEVALYLAEFLNGHQLTTIEFLPAKQIKPGSYWTFYTSTPETFHVMVGKAAFEPLLDGTIIHVDWVESDTAEQVAQKTKIAINQFYFAAPDLRGAFIRGWDEAMQIDLGYRYFPYGQGLIRNHLGSFQLDEIYAHNHPPFFGGQYVFAYTSPSGNAYSGGDNTVNFSLNTGDRGGEESRPINFAVNFVIKI